MSNKQKFQATLVGFGFLIGVISGSILELFIYQ